MPINNLKVSEFNEFCEVFGIITDKVAGDSGSD